jgi:hypothetical protein
MSEASIPLVVGPESTDAQGHSNTDLEKFHHSLEEGDGLYVSWIGTQF